MHSYVGPKLCMELAADRVNSSAVGTLFVEGTCCSSDYCEEDTTKFFTHVAKPVFNARQTSQEGELIRL